MFGGIGNQRVVLDPLSNFKMGKILWLLAEPLVQMTTSTVGAELSY